VLPARCENPGVSAQPALVPLTGLDGVFLDLETPATPMHVGSLHFFEPPARGPREFYALIRRMLAARLNVAPIFGRRLASAPLNIAHPVWLDNARIDLNYHVRRMTVPPPGGRAEVERCVADLHAELMDRAHPLWQMTVLEGLADGRCAYYFKVHHAVLDGVSSMALAAALYDTGPTPARRPRSSRPRPRTSPGLIEVAGTVLRHDVSQLVRVLRYLPDAARTLAELVTAPPPRRFTFGPRTPLNATITGERSVAFVPVPLAEVKAVGARHQATVNDVVLALCSAALRGYLARHGGVPKEPLIAAMPISVRDPGDARYGTEATMSFLPLPTQLADPLRQLKKITATTAAVKAAHRARPHLPTDFPSVGVPWLAASLAALYARGHVADVVPPIANVIISNVPGPRAPLYTVGLKMQEYWPLSIVEHGVGVNITVISYVDTLEFGVTAARALVPEAREIADGLAAAHVALKRAASARPRRAAARSRRR